MIANEESGAVPVDSDVLDEGDGAGHGFGGERGGGPERIPDGVEDEGNAGEVAGQLAVIAGHGGGGDGVLVEVVVEPA